MFIEVDFYLTEEKISSIKASIKRKQRQLLIKRFTDTVLSLFCIILLSPLLVLVAILIKLTSRGDILYSNKRAGYNGSYFRCYKFRSMASDQFKKEDIFKQALDQQQKGILLKFPNDSRVTWVGKIIRKSSIDELPQLFNVLMGDMSFVGPRPLIPFMLDHLPEFKEVRGVVRPGITGLWQIRDRRNNTSADFMTKHDLEYISRYSLIRDIQILLATPMVVLKADGAY